jgi:hypothetical protein
MTLEEIILKLVGPIEPIGDSRVDEERFENLNNLCDLVDHLVSYIDHVGCNKDRVECSMRRAGEYADNFLSETLGIKD